MKRLTFAGFLLLCSLSWGSEPCQFTPTRHGRRVGRADEKAVLGRTGISWSNHSDYLVGRIVPLELGGANDLANVQALPTEEARFKESIEDAVANCVCIGTLPIHEAQFSLRRWREVEPGRPCQPVRPKPLVPIP